MENTRTRRTFSQSQKQALVTAWEASGQNAYVFAKARGVGYASLVRWKEKLGRVQTPPTAFLPVSVVSREPEGPRVVAQVAVRGLQVQIMAGATQEELSGVLAALQAVRT